MSIEITQVDPQCPEALRLLLEAAKEARQVHPELHRPEDPWPTNEPTTAGGAYFLASIQGEPVAMGSHRPIDRERSEVRRIFTLASARRNGAARAIMTAVERHAREQGFVWLLLQTGDRQVAAISMYESLGYRRIEPFGTFRDDPTSVCFAKRLRDQEMHPDSCR